MTVDKEPRPTIGEFLRSNRNEQLLSLRAIGADGLSSSYLSQLENDVFADVKVTRLIEIAEAYNIPITRILWEVYGYDVFRNQEHSSEEIVEVQRAQQIGKLVLSLNPEQRDTVIGFASYLQGKNDAK